MHRSRPTVLVIFAAVAACSTHDDSKGIDALSKDPALVARLQAIQQARPQALPSACGTVAVAAQPSNANKAQADELTRRAYDAEMQGNVQEARTLLQRASQLDATNKSAAYHLGITSETLGDHTAAVTAYCRYLALAPTTSEAAEARQRVTKLSQMPTTPTTTRVASGSVSERAANVRRAPITSARRVERTPRTVEPSVVASGEVRSPRVARSTSVARTTVESPAPSEPVNVARQGDGTAERAAAGGDVVATSSPEPVVDQRPTAPPTVQRGPNRAQSAGIGAAAGAIIGAATGRSVKSAIIGAAAGGIFGTAVGGMGRPISGRI